MYTHTHSHATNIKLHLKNGRGGKGKNPGAAVELERIWIWPWIICMLPLSYKSLLKTLQTLRGGIGGNPTRHIAFVHIFRPTETLPQSFTFLFILHNLFYIIFWIVKCREILCQCQSNARLTEDFPLPFMKVDVVTTCDPPQNEWPRALTHMHTNTSIHQNWTADNHHFIHLNVVKSSQTVFLHI